MGQVHSRVLRWEYNGEQIWVHLQKTTTNDRLQRRKLEAPLTQHRCGFSGPPRSLAWILLVFSAGNAACVAEYAVHIAGQMDGE